MGLVSKWAFIHATISFFWPSMVSPKTCTMSWRLAFVFKVSTPVNGAFRSLCHCYSPLSASFATHCTLTSCFFCSSATHNASCSSASLRPSILSLHCFWGLFSLTLSCHLRSQISVPAIVQWALSIKFFHNLLWEVAVCLQKCVKLSLDWVGGQGSSTSDTFPFGLDCWCVEHSWWDGPQEHWWGCTNGEHGSVWHHRWQCKRVMRDCRGGESLGDNHCVGLQVLTIVDCIICVIIWLRVVRIFHWIGRVFIIRFIIKILDSNRETAWYMAWRCGCWDIGCVIFISEDIMIDGPAAALPKCSNDCCWLESFAADIHVLLDKIFMWHFFTSLFNNLITSLWPGMLEWTEHSNIERLEYMSCVGWEAKQDDVVLSGKVDELKLLMWTMAIIDKKNRFARGVSCSCPGNEWIFEPLFTEKCWAGTYSAQQKVTQMLDLQLVRFEVTTC